VQKGVAERVSVSDPENVCVARTRLTAGALSETVPFRTASSRRCSSSPPDGGKPK
jgi:hypothetical protein